MSEFIDDRYPHPPAARCGEDAAPQPMPWWLLAILVLGLAGWAVFAGVVWWLGRMIESAIALGWPL